MFRIGEFSRIAQVSGRLLRYYDQLGLISPDRIDDQTGYRYYSAAQLPQLNRILALKDLGFTLDQIRDLLRENPTADELRGMLVLKKAQAEQELAEQATRLRSIENRIQQIDGGGSASGLDVVIKSVPDQVFFSVRSIQPTIFDLLAHIVEIRRAAAEQASELATATLATLLHGDSFETEQMDVEVGYLLDRPTSRSLRLRSGASLAARPLAGTASAATAIAVGGPEACVRSYSAIGRWIEAHGFGISGLSREVMLVPPQGFQVSEMVLEIQFPIEAQPSGT